MSHYSPLSPCGCFDSTVTPTPKSTDKCRATLRPSDFGTLVYLLGLDEEQCEKLMLLSDALGLQDCNGEVVTPESGGLVTCVGFRPRLCDLLPTFAVAGEATGETRLIGTDCQAYTVPIQPALQETPNSEMPTATIALAVSGELGRVISAEVILSDDAGNAIEVRDDGLYVAEFAAPDVCASLAALPLGTPATEGTVVVGADCQQHALVLPEPLGVQASPSVALGITDNYLQANVIRDPSPQNLLQETAGGLLVSCASVAACAAPPLVDDTPTVELSVVGSTLSAEVRVSSAPGNALVETPQGLLVDVCAALPSTPPIPATLGSTRLLGADCAVYTIPETPVQVQDTLTVSLVSSGAARHSLKANARIAPGTLLQAVPQGLAVPCTAVQDCAFGTNNTFWDYNPVSRQVAFNPSADAGNRIVVGTDGRPYVAEQPLSVVATDCIGLGLSPEGELAAFPILSLDSENVLQCRPDGLFVSLTPSPVEVTADTTSSVQLLVSEAPLETFTLSASVRVSGVAGNGISIQPDGLYAATSGSAESTQPRGLMAATPGVAATAVTSGDVIIADTVTMLVENPSATCPALLFVRSQNPAIRLVATTGVVSVNIQTLRSFNIPGAIVTPLAALTDWQVTTDTNGTATPQSIIDEMVLVIPAGAGGDITQTYSATVLAGSGTLTRGANALTTETLVQCS